MRPEQIPADWLEQMHPDARESVMQGTDDLTTLPGWNTFAQIIYDLGLEEAQRRQSISAGRKSKKRKVA